MPLTFAEMLEELERLKDTCFTEGTKAILRDDMFLAETWRRSAERLATVVKKGRERAGLLRKSPSVYRK